MKKNALNRALALTVLLITCIGLIPRQAHAANFAKTINVQSILVHSATEFTVTIQNPGSAEIVLSRVKPWNTVTVPITIIADVPPGNPMWIYYECTEDALFHFCTPKAPKVNILFIHVRSVADLRPGM